jgi:WhiB family transcriptional regulator, redox-sensing transcriptional regulator
VPLVDLEELARDLREVPSWTRDALCIEYPAVNWFAELGAHPDDLAEAKAVCARCMVREECLEYAESRPACRDHGVWGGLSVHERRALRRSAVLNQSSARRETTENSAKRRVA